MKKKNIAQVFYRASGVVLLALVFIGAELQAQNPARELLRYGELAYAEAIRVPSDKPGSAKVDVLLRVSYDFLVFTKTGKYSSDSTFSAGLDVSIDVKKLPDTYVSSENKKTEVYSSEYESTNTRDKFVLLKESFYIDSGRYVFDVEINDEMSTRKKSFKLPVTITQYFEEDSLVAGSIIPVKQDGEHVAILGYGGRLLFAHPTVFAVTASGVDGAIWQLKIDRMTEEGRQPVISTSIVPTSILRGLSLNRESGIVHSFDLQPGEDRTAVWVVFKPALDTLSVGKYAFTLHYRKGTVVDSLTQRIDVFWQEMPISLYDPVFATELMRYITTEDEYDELTSGDNEERRQKLEAWWKKNDPTPATPYNERMYEYFRRVDEAYFRFQTTKRVNGALTDRGKVFILYGEPETIDRELRSDEPPVEIWHYPSLKKTFKFTDRERNGNYRLAN